MKEGRGGQRPPPPPRGQSGKVGRQRREGAGRTTRPCPKEARAVPAPAGGASGEQTQGRRGDHGSHTASPPPCRGTSAAPRACAVLATCLSQRTHNEGAPPPFSPTHLGEGRGQQGGGEGTWGGGRGQTDMPGEETGGERWRRKKKPRTKGTNAPGEESEKTGTKTPANGGRPERHGPAGDAGEVPNHGDMGDPKGKTAPPPPLQPRPVLASCLRYACDMRATEGRRQGRQGG